MKLNEETVSPLLEVDKMTTAFTTRGKEKNVVVDAISFSVKEGEIVAIVGESGSGKSITSLSIMGLLKRGGQVISGAISFDGKNIESMSKQERRKLRGNEMAMIFQEPMSSLNPMLKINTQIAEVLITHEKLSRTEVDRKVVQLLKEVEIPDAENVAKRFPHQLSGGMRQRVMIAMALACKPRLLIADEPTTALDVTIQAQILALIKELNQQHHTGIILITHDLSVVAEIADRVIVMYAGKIVEEATVYNLFANPQHPYTMGLMKAMPKLEEQVEFLDVIPGNAPFGKRPSGCPFHTRCPRVTDDCVAAFPEVMKISETHAVHCLFPGKEGEEDE
ncbi:ABC transporter ATP-binding protein [Evansella sp. AB-rgal1]|uniref:ABC transporter ATP-binding protein n=1 Tax=Evansella sp. AB-rgal1 TaxID=3242696 RepID=UPI00359D722F